MSGPVRLRAAQEALEALAISSPLTMAQAEEAAADAAVVLDHTQEAFDDLLNPEDADVATARKAVASARLALKDAEDGLEDLQWDHSLRLSQAQQN